MGIFCLERASRIELPAHPWQGRVLPLYDTRSHAKHGIFNFQFLILNQISIFKFRNLDIKNSFKI